MNYKPIIDNNEATNLNRKFGFIMAGVWLFIAAFRFFFKHEHFFVMAGIALILLGLAHIKPIWLNPIRLVWERIGHVLGIINTFVLLTVFYCLVLTPMGLLMRLFGKDILKLKRLATQQSYWEPAPKIEKSKMENQF